MSYLKKNESTNRIKTERVCEKVRAHRHPRESGDPEARKRCASPLDSRFRGNDALAGRSAPTAREAFHTRSQVA